MDELQAKYGTHKNGHSLFAPSASAGWLNCSAYLLVNARAGDSAGIDAATGTIAHLVAEEWNKSGKRPDHMIGKEYVAHAGGTEFHIEVTSDMLYHVGRFVEWCQEIPGDHYYEQRVDLSDLFPIPGQGGTADHFVCEPFKLTITDLKYGTGVRVFAEGNTQALLYASGVFMEWDWIYGFEEIVIRICQPRLDVFETWTITRKQLLEFMAYVRGRALLAWDEKAARTPSPKACQWCAGFERCPARLAAFDDIVDQVFDAELDDDKLQPITHEDDELRKHTDLAAGVGRAAYFLQSKGAVINNEVSIPALAYAYTFRKSFEDWFKAVGELLLDEAEKGTTVPYLTLSEGRNNRRWKSKDEVVEAVSTRFPQVDEDDLAPRKVASVKAVEKAIRTRVGLTPKEVTSAIEDLIQNVRSKRSLVLALDDRPEPDDLLDDFDPDDEDDL